MAFGLIAALALLAFSLSPLLDLDERRTRIEAAASEAVGMEVRIPGGMRLDFFPPVGVSFTDVHVSRGGTDILRVERVRTGLKLLPLLLGRVRVRNIELTRPELSVRRTGSGPLDFERYILGPLRTARRNVPGNLDRIAGITVSGGTVSYAGADSAFRTEVEGLEVKIRDVAFQPAGGSDPFREVSFAGTAKASRAAVGDAEGRNLSFGITAKNGNYEIRAESLEAFGGAGKGNVWISLAETSPLIQVRLSLEGFRVERLFEAHSPEGAPMSGTMDFFANLFVKGNDPDGMAATMTGDVSWKGSGLTVHAFEPEEVLAVAGQGNGAGMGRFLPILLPGPPFIPSPAEAPGPGSVEAQSEAEGPVETLVSRWSVEKGVFEAQDAALATGAHRVALAGRLDLPGRRYDGVTVALVDAGGCVLAARTIRGPFDAPQTEGAPAGDRAGTSAAPGPSCPVFYSGSVPPPE